MKLIPAKYTSSILAVVIIITSCQPKIYSFKSEHSIVSQTDTIKLHWKTRGKPTLLIHEKTAADDPANIKPGDQLVEFILGFKHSNVNANTRVLITADNGIDTILFVPSTINGDSLIATGNSLPEALYTIKSISTPIHRELYVWHRDQMFLLTKDGSDYVPIHPLLIEGPWRIALKMTPAEQKNPSTAPPIFKLVIHKQHI